MHMPNSHREIEGKNIALYFGSFNPLHIGHLALANYIVTKSEIHEVWFVLSPLNPLKEKKDQLPFEFRCRNIELAIKDDSRFKLCTIEQMLPLPHYTVGSIRSLRVLYPQHQFHLLIGADNWTTIEQWHEYQRLLDLIPIYIYPRRGYDIEPQSLQRGKSITYLHEAPIMEISSTQIRQVALNNSDLRHWLAVKDLWPELTNLIHELDKSAD